VIVNDCIELDVCKCTSQLDILYVEDDNRLREETLDILESFFHSVDTAVDGFDAMQKYTLHKKETHVYYDLIITDLNMPNKTGEELIKDIIQINSDQDIIVISAYNESERLISLIQQGISNFVMKPIEPTQLMGMLYKTCKNISSEKQKEKYILEQAKMASVGEMIESISHQWRQPLNTVNGLASLIINRTQKDKMDKEELKMHLKTILTQTEYLSETVDVFRNFLKEKNNYQEVILQDRILKALSIVQISLNENFIDLRVNLDKTPPINLLLIIGELSQVIINIINNAKDVLVEKNIKNPWIEVSLTTKQENVIITIEDNAGGIPEVILPNIFDQYFTTKDAKNGTGIGLYMSKNIMHKSFQGDLYAQNSSHGAVFTIIFPIKKD
jgi:signal transduction histidine kinase